MIKNILVAYHTETGSTRRAAEIICDEIKLNEELKVEISDIKDIKSVKEYDLVIIGTPLWFGNPTPEIQSFLKTHQCTLKNMPTALYLTCLGLAECSTDTNDDTLIYRDPVLESVIKSQQDMSMWDKMHADSYYVGNLKKIAPAFSPSSIAFFKGNLHYSKLSTSHRIIMNITSWFNTALIEGEYLSEKSLQDWVKSHLSLLISGELKFDHKTDKSDISNDSHSSEEENEKPTEKPSSDKPNGVGSLLAATSSSLFHAGNTIVEAGTSVFKGAAAYINGAGKSS